MKYLAVLLLVVTITGCDDGIPNAALTPPSERPTVNLPVALRQANWPGSERGGSCVHATMISLLRWQGRPNMAAWWRKSHENGEWYGSMAEKLDRAGVRFAMTAERNDVAFLEWACSTRRGCGVTVHGGRHMVALVHLDSEWAGILDDNDISRIRWVPRKRFLAEWLNSNSWALTPVYTPAPPLPVRKPKS